MANKDGRPPVDDPKQKILGVRVTVSDHERIKKYAEGLELLQIKEEKDN